jgi:hypothetical protein
LLVDRAILWLLKVQRDISLPALRAAA